MPVKYDAFISYSHADSGKIAPVIQQALENIGKPWYRIGRRLNVFRDETSLSASPELWHTITGKLDLSDNFILLASPVAAASPWVNAEIEYWLQRKDKEGRAGPVYIILTDGEIVWDRDTASFNWDYTTAIPKTLSAHFEDEPLWIDIRSYITKNQAGKSIDYKTPGFAASVARILGGILQEDPRDIESEELHRRRKVNTFMLLTAALLLALVMGAYFFYRQSKTEKLQSSVSNLVAQANTIGETNISEALHQYVKAYLTLPNDGNFAILENFYKKNIFFGTFDTLNPVTKNWDTGPATDTINMFFKNIASVSKNEYKIAISQPHIVLPLKRVYYYSNQKLWWVDFNGKKGDTIHIPLSENFTCINNPVSDSVYFCNQQCKNDGRDTLLVGLNLSTQKFTSPFTPLLPGYTQEDAGAFTAAITTASPFILITQPMRFAMMYDENQQAVNYPFTIYNTQNGESRNINCRIKFESMNGSIMDMSLSPAGDRLYFRYSSLAEGAEYESNYYIFDTEKQQLLYRFTDLDNQLATSIITPTCFAWHYLPGAIFYGNKGGQLITRFGNNYSSNYHSYPNGQPPNEALSCILSLRTYTITGTEKGVLTFWETVADESMSADNYAIFNYLNQIISVQIPLVPVEGKDDDLSYKIEKIVWDENGKALLVANAAGDVYMLNPGVYEKLSRQPDSLLQQLNSIVPGIK